MIVDFQKLRTYASFSSVEWICGFEFDRQTQRPCFVYGFDWRKFIVWNIDNDQNILFEEDCGGGHRSFDVSIEQSILQIKNFFIFFTLKLDLLLFFCRVSRRASWENLPVNKTKIEVIFLNQSYPQFQFNQFFQ